MEWARPKLCAFFRRYYYDSLLKAVREGDQSIVIDYRKLDRFDPKLSELLLNSPDEFFKHASEALEDIDFGIDKKIKLNIRVKEVDMVEKIKRIRDLRAKHIGKFIRVEGVVRRASEVIPEVEIAIFECPGCMEKIEIVQDRRSLVAPTDCECGRRRNFKLVGKKLCDLRILKLEDPFDVSIGEKPGELTVFLRDDLTTPKMQSKTDPGSTLDINGIVRSAFRIVGGKRAKQMEVWLEANYVEPTQTEFEEIEITQEDEAKIKRLAKEKGIYEKLIDSIAPSMYGLRDIKEAIVMQLFSGVPHTLKDGTRIRGDLHILLVGDPASGKTQLLKLVSQLVPRGRYVSGKGVSAAGLTATVVRDEEFLGGWTLEAGALVLCNKSVISIDEFDKIGKEDMINMHEAMSTQTVSVAKATIFATLPAKTAVLAGSNPKFSRFDPMRPIAEQIDIPQTLLSRFDLKFVVRDVPDKEKDAKMIDHIIRMRTNGGEIKPPIELSLLRKYIAYARLNCKPKLGKEAAKILKDFYVKLRAKYAAEEGFGVPLTLRQYEGLMRIAEASAKIRLAKTVGEGDAKRAIRLMHKSLKQLGLDPETGKLDIDRVEGATTSTHRSKLRIIMDTIDILAKKFGREIPYDDLIEAARDEGVEDAEKIIQDLRTRGIIFEPRHGYIQRVM